ncbi:MAG TPA: NUDIX domain-containing protein [Beijerinckiaceae bacterium]|jgi:ADP-ribose pyrophosphatase YjhB (NUDIX family)
MHGFAESYLGRLRGIVGSRLLLVPGARIVIENAAGEVLLQQRSDFRLWGVPGGVPDEGEDLTAAVLRETLEETGLTVEDATPFGFASDPAHEVWTYPNGDRCHYFTLMYTARRYHGSLRALDGESLALGWFRLDALPPLLPVMERTLGAYERYRETGAFQMM